MDDADAGLLMLQGVVEVVVENSWVYELEEVLLHSQHFDERHHHHHHQGRTRRRRRMDRLDSTKA